MVIWRNESIRQHIKGKAPKLLAGFNTDEGSLFVPPTTTETDYKALVGSVFGKNAAKVMARFPVTKDKNVHSQMNDVITLSLLRSGTYRYADALAKKNDVYMYHFDYVDPMIRPTGLGVIHGSEIKYVFHNFMDEVNKDDDAKHVASVMQTAWVNFIKNGNPNKGMTLPDNNQWDKYNPSSPAELHISVKPAMQSMYKEEDVKFINQLLQQQK